MGRFDLRRYVRFRDHERIFRWAFGLVIVAIGLSISFVFDSTEEWILIHGTKPTITGLATIFLLLSIATVLAGRVQPWTPPMRAFFFFMLANTLIWVYFMFGVYGWPRPWELRLRFPLYWSVMVTGIWFMFSFTFYYILPVEASTWTNAQRRIGHNARRFGRWFWHAFIRHEQEPPAG